MNTDRIQLVFFLVLFVGIGLLAFFVFHPFLNVIITAAIFAVVFNPLYKQILDKTHGRSGISAALVVIVVAAIVLSLLFMLGSNIFYESRDLYHSLNTGDVGFLTVVTDAIQTPLQKFFPDFSIDIKGYVDTAVESIGVYVSAILSATAAGIFAFFLGMVSFYYFLRDGDKFKDHLVAISPLKDEYDIHIVHKMKEAINVVVKGTLLIALIQGALVGIGLAIFGVPNATLWGSLAVICAIIPGVGTAIVLLPAVGYLAIQDMAGQAMGLAIWGLFMVGLIDNLLAPYVYGRGVNIHPLIILFSVLGGLAFFGPIGFLFGPLVVTLLFVLLHIYKIIILKAEKEQLD